MCVVYVGLRFSDDYGELRESFEYSECFLFFRLSGLECLTEIRGDQG